MKTTETIATVTKDGKITAQLPLHILEGEYQVVIVIYEKLLAEKAERKEKKRKESASQIFRLSCRISLGKFNFPQRRPLCKRLITLYSSIPIF